MRSFRKVALAGATAVAVAFGSTTIAAAQTEGETQDQTVEVPAPSPREDGKAVTTAATLNELLNLEAAQYANGAAIFGSSKDGWQEAAAEQLKAQGLTDEEITAKITEAEADVEEWNTLISEKFNGKKVGELTVSQIKEAATLEAPEGNQFATYLEVEKFVATNTEGISSQPNWAKWLFAGGIIAAIGAVFTLIVAPIANYLTFGPGAR